MLVAAIEPCFSGMEGIAPLLLSGTTQPPLSCTTAVLAVLAAGLRQAPGGPDSAVPQREAAFRIRCLSLRPDLKADPAGRAFTPPPDFDEAAERVAEVHTTDGRQLRLGEACLVEGLAIRCLREPQGDLQLRIVGPGVPGYVERRRCEIDVSLTAWGSPTDRWEDEMESADRLVSAAIGATLRKLFERDSFDLGAHAGAGFEMRLLRPQATLQSVTRGPRLAGDVSVMCAQAAILLQGELVTTLVSDSAAPEAEVIRAAPLDVLTVVGLRVALQPAGED